MAKNYFIQDDTVVDEKTNRQRLSESARIVASELKDWEGRPKSKERDETVAGLKRELARLVGPGGKTDWHEHKTDDPAPKGHYDPAQDFRNDTVGGGRGGQGGPTAAQNAERYKPAPNAVRSAIASGLAGWKSLKETGADMADTALQSSVDSASLGALKYGQAGTRSLMYGTPFREELQGVKDMQEGMSRRNPATWYSTGGAGHMARSTIGAPVSALGMLGRNVVEGATSGYLQNEDLGDAAITGALAVPATGLAQGIKFGIDKAVKSSVVQHITKNIEEAAERVKSLVGKATPSWAKGHTQEAIVAATLSPHTEGMMNPLRSTIWLAAAQGEPLAKKLVAQATNAAKEPKKLQEVSALSGEDLYKYAANRVKNRQSAEVSSLLKDAGRVGLTTLGGAAGGAGLGGVAGAAQAAITGQDIGMGAQSGATTGAVLGGGAAGGYGLYQRGTNILRGVPTVLATRSPSMLAQVPATAAMTGTQTVGPTITSTMAGDRLRAISEQERQKRLKGAPQPVVAPPEPVSYFGEEVPASAPRDYFIKE